MYTFRFDVIRVRLVEWRRFGHVTQTTAAAQKVGQQSSQPSQARFHPFRLAQAVEIAELDEKFSVRGEGFSEAVIVVFSGSEVVVLPRLVEREEFFVEVLPLCGGRRVAVVLVPD